MRILSVFKLALITVYLTSSLYAEKAVADQVELIHVSSDRRSFQLFPSGNPFIPWGFNYDHDEKGRLIEEYWVTEWSKVVEDFKEMRSLGANVVRVHLQFGRFMDSPSRPNRGPFINSSGSSIWRSD